MKYFITILLALLCGRVSAAQLWLETESFSDKGGWVVDQQFMDLMGSPYLMAHGMGKPVADAVTSVEIPSDGLWHVYVRTYNWTSPWTSENGPGAFRVKVGRRTLKTVLGTEGDCWMWQYAGSVRLKSGQVPVALSDMTGFNGRCDAIYMTTEEGSLPPSDLPELEAFRRRSLGIPDNPESACYDFVVAGGGIAGMCAAVAAAPAIEKSNCSRRRNPG